MSALGGGNSYATGINNSGQVVGYSEIDSNGTTDAFLYDSANGTMKDLGTLGGSYSYANGINDSGEVVGSLLPAAVRHMPSSTTARCTTLVP